MGEDVGSSNMISENININTGYSISLYLRAQAINLLKVHVFWMILENPSIRK